MDSKFVVVAFAILIALVSGGGLVWWYNSSSAPCNKMAEKCQDNWGACFARPGYNGYNGDACCSEGSAYKCVEDMTIYERITKDAAYAKMISCVLAEHPDLPSVEKCLPKPTDCKSPRWCSLGSDESRAQIDKCPKLLKCWLQKHSDLEAFMKCWPRDLSEKACNAP
uniref:DB domain-containing protein n=1 Tax=Globodera pallida TaxID=36090 RepID=A0A183C8V9_GLOPA